MDFFEFKAQMDQVGDAALMRVGQRRGQYYMNQLGHVRPDLYAKVTGTPSDPFHEDKKINDFWGFLIEHWEGK